MPLEQKEGEIIFYADTTNVVSQSTEFNVCISWQEPLEELSNKEINHNIDDFQFVGQLSQK